MNKNSFALFTFLSVMAAAVQACYVPGNDAEPVAAAPGPVLAQPEIVHSVFPSQGVDQVAKAHDNEESEAFEDKNVKNGDIFDANRFERPFTASEMDYLPYVDIVDIRMTTDHTFYYVQISLAGVDETTGGIRGSYGVDYDLNLDGKAEVLLVADAPGTNKWTTDGVRVYLDENGDVGGETIKPDALYTGDGFESLVFDGGSGDDPDLAWVHFSNNATPIVEFAIRRTALKDSTRFMWSAMAADFKLDPAKLYFNDTLSTERAGSPFKGDENYPLDELSGFDNTCRLPAGFVPTGVEPLGCVTSGPERGGGEGQASSGGNGGAGGPATCGVICYDTCYPMPCY